MPVAYTTGSIRAPCPVRASLLGSRAQRREGRKGVCKHTERARDELGYRRSSCDKADRVAALTLRKTQLPSEGSTITYIYVSGCSRRGRKTRLSETRHRGVGGTHCTPLRGRYQPQLRERCPVQVLVRRRVSIDRPGVTGALPAQKPRENIHAAGDGRARHALRAPPPRVAYFFRHRHQRRIR